MIKPQVENSITTLYQYYSSDKTSSRKFDNNGEANPRLMAKHYKEVVSDDELYMFSTYDQLQDTYEKLHEKTNNMTKMLGYKRCIIFNLENQVKD